MATQSQSQIETELRRSLRAEGYAEDVIQFVIDASRERLRRNMVDFAEDGWTRHMRSTAACAQTKL